MDYPVVVAILAVKNEEAYLPVCFEHLVSQGVRIAVIDNDSTDSTPEICKSFEGRGLIYYERFPYRDEYDLRALLTRKAELRKELNADWIIHHDADEVMQSDRDGETLLEAVARIDALGYDSINFDEFVFLPENDSVDYLGHNYLKEMKFFYLFAPKPVRLIRAFKNSLTFDNVEYAGHRLPLNEIQLYPTNLILRHYICLSMEYAAKKYLNRDFSKAAVARGWHKNRVNMKREDIQAPSPGRLNYLGSNEIEVFRKAKAESTHFWSWRNGESSEGNS